ncbi:VTT domain-containing protein, partial [bacterium]|nr:VTT domain-containing protein [bacterium]
FFTYVPGFTQELFSYVQGLYEEWNFWVVFTAAFTPIPYKVFTIAAGVFEINFLGFLLASIIGRSARFFIVGALIWKFGETIKDFIDKYFNLVATAFTVLLIGGFALIKFFIH